MKASGGYNVIVAVGGRQVYGFPPGETFLPFFKPISLIQLQPTILFLIPHRFHIRLLHNARFSGYFKLMFFLIAGFADDHQQAIMTARRLEDTVEFAMMKILAVQVLSVLPLDDHIKAAAIVVVVPDLEIRVIVYPLQKLYLYTRISIRSSLLGISGKPGKQ